MKTRVGKIARLPAIIREQLNRKLQDGLPGKVVLAWLNDLPDVKKTLAELFGGHPVTEQNLSDWRHGGYADWTHTRDGRKQWWELMESAGKLTQARNPTGDLDVTRYLGTFLIVELAEALDELHDMKDSDKRRKLLRIISIALSRLRTDDSREKRLRLTQCKQAARNSQIHGSPTHSNPQKKFLSSLAPETTVVPPANRALC